MNMYGAAPAAEIGGAGFRSPPFIGRLAATENAAAGLIGII